MKLADPIDRMVATTLRGPVLKDRLHQSGAGRVIEAALSHAAGVASPLTERVAATIYSYDQDYIDRPWSRLGKGQRETYYEIAEAVIAEVRA